MIEWKNVAVYIFEKLADSGIDRLSHNEKIVSTLKMLGVDPDPPPDFEGCYIHTLVEYGIHAKESYGVTRGQPLIDFFTHQETRDLFQKWVEDAAQKPETFEKNANEIILWDKVGEALRHVKLDEQIRQEFQLFVQLFHQHVDRTRSAAQIRIESKVDRLLADVEDLPQTVFETMKKEVLVALQQPNVIISDDGLPIADTNHLAPPLKQFNPQFLESLYEPSGAVKLRDTFYIERDADALLKHQIKQDGSITTIRAPRQTGKSSLLIRGLQYARQKSFDVVRIDLQGIEKSHLQSQELFLLNLAELIIRKLRLNLAEMTQAWQGSLGAQSKLSLLMENYILPESRERLILMIDEADRLLETDFSHDFFSLMRTWYNNTALEDVWEKLNICLVISTEPHLLIPDLTQSPFNVGLRLNLRDFTEAQIRDLNRRHGSPLSENDIPSFIALLNGHPYLTRRALYHMVMNSLSWQELQQMATSTNGPFGEHLSYHYRLLYDKTELREALKQVMRNQIPNETVLYRLLSAGLVKGYADEYTLRCELYHLYFKEKFE